MPSYNQYEHKILGYEKQQKLAEQLRNAQVPQGQMIGQHYVAANPLGQIGSLLRQYTGIEMEDKAQKGIESTRAEQGQALKDWYSSAPKATTTETEMAGPYAPEQGIQAPTQKITTQPTMDQQIDWLNQGYQIDPNSALFGAKRVEMQQQREIEREKIAAELRRRAEERDWRTEERNSQREFMAAQNDLNRQNTRAIASSNQAAARERQLNAPEKPPTEFQGKSLGYGTRAASSHNILDKFQGNYNPLAVNTANSSVGPVANFFISPENQQVAQAQRDFLNAVLRQESGAVISESEFKNANRQYFPQPGDSPEVIQQKRANRELAIKGFATSAGPHGAQISEILANPLPAYTPPTAGKKGGSVVSGVKFLGFE